MEIRKRKRSTITEVDFDNLNFGEHFSDHMYTLDYRGNEWVDERITPFGPIELLPSVCSLHYGQIIFEGLKAFWNSDGAAHLFRPEAYHARLLRSNDRLCIPPLPYDYFINGIVELLKIDKAWIPRKQGCALYIRPFIFATDSFLGVRVSHTYSFMIITCPVGAYYKEGMNPVSLITAGEYVRASSGGLGAAKTPANYAASLYPAEIAKKKGYTQVLWLDAKEHRYIEEVGTMNIMFVLNGELVTPPLTGGSILGGVTRDSVLTLAKSWNIPIQEREITIEEVFEETKKGNLTEVFGTGTAAVISPVGWIEHNNEKITINNEKIGPLAERFYDEITGIQYGERPDPFGWCKAIHFE